MQHLASLSLPASSGSSGSSSSSAAASRHHILPSSISPTMDLALVFTTTAPSVNAPAAAPTAPNQAGLSAAQKLIQQRMAMMRARAAAAAGLATSSASAEDASGPLKGQPIQMTLWRTGSGTEAVWQKAISVPDAIFGRDNTTRPHQTLEVGGMTWSPSGRRIALHLIVSRSDASAQPLAAHSLVALYNVHDGGLLKVIPLSKASSPDLLPRLGTLSWAKLQPRPVPDARRGRSLRHSIIITGVSAFLDGKGRGGGGPGNARFQQYMGGAGKAQARSQRALHSMLPSLKGLESEHAAAQDGEEDAEGGDYFRGWHTQPDDGEVTVLAVPGRSGDRHGVHLLLYARIPIAFVPLSATDAELLASHVLEEDAVVLQGRTVSPPSLDYQVSRLPSLDSSTLNLIRLMSELHSSCSQALDHSCMLKVVFDSLMRPAPADLTSLSDAQLAALPPLRRLTWSIAKLAGSLGERFKEGITTAICTGTYTPLIETMLLNTFSESKWRAEREAIVEVYKIVEFVASELVAALSDLTSQLCELRGVSASLLPTKGVASLLAPCVTGAYLERQLDAISTAQSSAHQVIQYAQGERLAWDEMDKWVRWERDRIEGTKTDQRDPMDPKTFDPVVVVELALRDFACKELEWILLGEVDTGVSGDDEEGGEGEGDESEESFQVARREEESSQQQHKEPAGLEAPPANSSTMMSSHEVKATAPRPSLGASLQSSLAWLRDDDDDDESGQSATGGEAAAAVPAPRQDGFEHLFQAGHLPSDDERPTVYSQTPLEKLLRSAVLAIKAAFMGIPDRLQEEASTVFTGEYALEDLANSSDQADEDDTIVSLPAPRPRKDTPTAQPLRCRSIVTADGRLLSAILIEGGQTVLLTWQALNPEAASSARARTSSSRSSIKVKLGRLVERLEIMDEERLFLVSGGNFECLGLGALYDLAATEGRDEVDGEELDGMMMAREQLGAEATNVAVALSKGRNTACVLEGSQTGAATLNFWDASAQDDGDGDEDEAMS